MNAEQLANTPVAITLDGVDGNGGPLAIALKLARSLPAAAALALNDDLVTLGKSSLNGYKRVQAQLDWLWNEAKRATAAKDRDAAERYTAAWNRMLDRLHDTIQSGEAEDLARVQYWMEGRRSVAGICREITARAEAAGCPAKLAELQAVITDGNAALVLSRLQAALGEIEDPTAAT